MLWILRIKLESCSLKLSGRSSIAEQYMWSLSKEHLIHSNGDFPIPKQRQQLACSKSFNHDHHLKELKLYHFFLTPYSGPTTLEFLVGSRAKTKNASVGSQLFYHCSSQTIPYLIEIFSHFILTYESVKCPWSEISDLWYFIFTLVYIMPSCFHNSPAR